MLHGLKQVFKKEMELMMMSRGGDTFRNGHRRIGQLRIGIFPWQQGIEQVEEKAELP